MDIYQNTNPTTDNGTKAYRSILNMDDNLLELKESTLLLYPNYSSFHISSPSLQTPTDYHRDVIDKLSPFSNKLKMNHQDHGDEKDDNDEEIDDDEIDEDDLVENGDGEEPDEEEGDEELAGEEEQEEDDSELEEDDDEFDDDEYDLDEDDDDEDDYDRDVN